MTEDKMVGWHHQVNGHELEKALGDGEGQVSLACYSPWGHKELDTTEQLNNWCPIPPSPRLALVRTVILCFQLQAKERPTQA